MDGCLAYTRSRVGLLCACEVVSVKLREWECEPRLLQRIIFQIEGIAWEVKFYWLSMVVRRPQTKVKQGGRSLLMVAIGDKSR